MIVNISPPGKNMQGMVAYLRDTSGIHQDPRLVTGSIGYTGSLENEELAELLAADLDLPAVLNRSRVPEKGHVWNAAVVLSSKDGQRPLSEWKNIAEDYMTKAGFNEPNVKWAAVNHGPNARGQDHVHVLMNRVTYDGVLVDTYLDMRKAGPICWELEDKYGLDPMLNRRAGVGTRGYSKNDHRMSKREAREPRRVELERRVRACAAGATTHEEFVKNLSKDAIKYRERKDTNGKAVGYSVQPPGVPSKYWWAGSTLAADLSLPRLEQTWKSPQATPTQVTAVTELAAIKTKAPTATKDELADMSHQLSNALAAASKVTEATPGPLAEHSRKVGAIAQTKAYQKGRKPPALSAGMLFLMCTDPTGPVGKAVMIQQMLAASRAVLDAHLSRARATVPSTEGNTRMAQQQQAAPEDEIIEAGVTVGATVGAMMIERHARNRTERKGWEADLPTAEWFRKSRIQDDVAKGLESFSKPSAKISPEQVEQVAKLAHQTDIAIPPEVISSLSAADAKSLITKLEYARGPQVPDPVRNKREQEKEAEDFLDGLERRAAERGTLHPKAVTLQQEAKTQNGAVSLPDAASKRGDAARVHNSPTIKQGPLTPADGGSLNFPKATKYTRGK